MNIFLITFAEFLFVSALILLLFKLRNQLGLAPLYIFLGSLQYLQTILAASFNIIVYDFYQISPGSILLFCSTLFAVLLVYIKEGVISTRSLIFGIVASNIALTFFTYLINLQASLAKQDVNIEVFKAALLTLDIKVFIIGTIVLVLDFFLLVIVYKYLSTVAKRLKLFPVIFLSLLAIYCFDAILFTSAAFYNSPRYQNILVSNIAGKAISAFLFAVALYLYVRYIDKGRAGAMLIADESKDIFSIFTYRKQYEALKVEKELGEKKLIAQIEETLNSMSDAFIAVDKNWDYTYLNIKAAEIFQKTPESLIGKNMWKVLPEPAKGLFIRYFQKALDTQQHVLFEGHVAHNNYWYECNIYPSVSGGLSVFFKDITERIKAAEDLKNSELLFRSLASQAPVGIFQTEVSGICTYVNEEWLKYAGKEFNEVAGVGWFNAIHPGDKERVTKEWQQAVSHGSEFTSEMRFGDDKGKTTWLTVKAIKLLNAESTIYGYIGMALDVSEIRKKERALKDSEEKFAKAFHSNAVGMALISSSGRIIEVNETLASLSATTRDYLLGKTVVEAGVIDLDNKANADIGNALWEEFRQNMHVKDREIEISLLNGKLKWLLISFELIHINDEENILVTVVDITEKKRADEQIVKTSQELRLLTQHLQNVREEERKRIGREIHDDLGQQLTAIKIYAAWINKKLPEGNPEIKEKIAGIIELTNSSNSAVRKILIELRIDMLDDDGLIDGLKWLCMQFEQTTSIELVFTTNLNKVNAGEQTAVCVYRILQEALTNITKHAEANKVMIDINVTADLLTMVIADDGKGFQIEKLQTVNSFGILGMKERVSAAEGEFRLESSKGAGTRLKIAVPV